MFYVLVIFFICSVVNESNFECQQFQLPSLSPLVKDLIRSGCCIPGSQKLKENSDFKTTKTASEVSNKEKNLTSHIL